VPDTSLHHFYFPTYYFNQTTAIHTENIPVLELHRCERAARGSPSHGHRQRNHPWKFLYDDQLTDSTNLYGQDWFTTPAGPAVNGNAVKNLVVILYDQQGTARDWTLTDASGNYTFDSLPAGTYSLQAERFGFGFENSQSVVITDQSPVATANPKLISNPMLSAVQTGNTSLATFKIFPNPSNDVVYLQFNDENQEGDIVILNTMGQTVLSRKAAPASNVLSIDTSSLPAGSYMVKVMTSVAAPVLQFIKY